jgi:purine-binding chemotaxis protein CheW
MATATKPAAAPVALSSRAGCRATAATFLAFRLPGVVCALPLAALREVVPMALLSRPPGMPSLLEGLLNLGGVAIPVVRLDRLFDLPEFTIGRYTPLLILRHSEDRLALLVEAVIGVIRVSPEEVRPVAAVCINDCVAGEATVGGATVHLLDADRLLLDRERQCLAELQSAEQQRLRRAEEARP